MRFIYLTEIGEHYRDEEGTPGVRNELHVWKGIETALKTAITDLRNLLNKSAAPAPTALGGKSFQDRVKFFESQSRQNAHEASITAVKARIDRLRTWLRMEGAYADKDGNIDFTKFKQLTVVYDHTLRKQGMTQVEFRKGELHVQGKPLDTTNMVTHFSGPGKAIYVVSSSGNLHVASHVVGHYHHSSLLCGLNVVCAGEIEVSNGMVLWISNKSGHYQPSTYHLCQALHLLQKKGVPMTFRVSVVGVINGHFGSVEEFLRALELSGRPDYELGKLMGYLPFLKNEILGANGWRWRDPTERPGVYTIGDPANGIPSQPVPPKLVRQWLKSQGYSPTFYVQSGRGR